MLALELLVVTSIKVYIGLEVESSILTAIEVYIGLGLGFVENCS